MQTETGESAMSEPQLTDQTPYSEQARAADGSTMAHSTWPQGTPALRIGKVHPEEVTAPPVSPQPRLVAMRAPWYLRLLRLTVGLTLLVLAWMGVLVIDLLVESALQPVNPYHVGRDTAFAVLKIMGACWIGVATLAAIVAGAFSLSLALTNRDWR